MDLSLGIVFLGVLLLSVGGRDDRLDEVGPPTDLLSLGGLLSLDNRTDFKAL